MKRREQANAGIDWDDIKRDIEMKLPMATVAVTEFCFSHGYKGRVVTGDYPPRLLISFYVPAPKDKRIKTVGLNISPRASEPNYIQVAAASDDDLDRFAMFISELAERLTLKPTRPHDHGGNLAELRYELRPIYKH